MAIFFSFLFFPFVSSVEIEQLLSTFSTPDDYSQRSYNWSLGTLSAENTKAFLTELFSSCRSMALLPSEMFQPTWVNYIASRTLTYKGLGNVGLSFSISTLLTNRRKQEERPPQLPQWEPPSTLLYLIERPGRFWNFLLLSIQKTDTVQIRDNTWTI